MNACIDLQFEHVKRIQAERRAEAAAHRRCGQLRHGKAPKRGRWAQGLGILRHRLTTGVRAVTG